MSSARVLLWCQHLLGTGHLKRTLTLGAAMAELGLDVTVASGGAPAPWLRVPGVRIVQLPWLRSTGADFGRLRDAGGEAPDRPFWRERLRVLSDLTARLEPAVVVTEMFPFGRRAFAAELDPWLDVLRRRRPRPWTLSSVRDVLVEPSKPSRHAEMLGRANALFDRVLVHSDPSLFPFDLTFAPAAALGDRLTYTGFVLDAALPQAVPDETGDVLVSAGGGAVGEHLLRAAIGARPRSRLAGCPWRLIGGGNLPDHVFAELAEACPPGMTIERHRPDFLELLATARLSISQAGYNTVLEILALGRRAVLVPFGQARETEQRTRAARLERLGLTVSLPEAELTAASLAEAVDAASRLPRPRAPRLDLAGARRTAELVATLARLSPP